MPLSNPLSASSAPVAPLLQRATKTVTFTGAAGVGATGNVPIFTTTGQVHVVRLVPIVQTTLVGTGATLALGSSDLSSLFIAATTATLLTTGAIWTTAGAGATGIALPATLREITLGANLVGTVAVAAVTAGVILFVVDYYPLSAGSSLA